MKRKRTTTPWRPAKARRDHPPVEIWTLWEVMHRLRMLIVTASLVAPIFLLARSRIVQEYWDRANPTRQAERLIKSGRIDPTYATVLERACDNSPDHPELLRALASLCASYDPARARRCYEQIEKLGATTVEDIAGRALLMAHLNSVADAEALLEGVKPDQANSPVILRAKLSLRVQRGDTAGAAQALGGLCRASADDPDPALEVAAALVKAGADSTLIATAERHAIEVLSQWNEAQRTSELPARLMKLLELPLQDTGSREAAHTLFTQLRSPDAAQCMAAAALARPASFSGREQERLRAAYMETSRRRGGIASWEKDRVADFLQHQGEHALVVELIPTSEALTERSLFQRRVTSMLYLGQWRDACNLVSVPDAPRNSYCQTLFHALTTLNIAPAATTHSVDLLVNALRDVAADGRAEACYAIGCAALDLHLPEIASDAFACALRITPADAQLLEGITNTSRRCHLPVKELNGIISRGLGNRMPSPLVAQRLCYLHLLDRDQVDKVRLFIQKQKISALDPVYVRFLEAMDAYQHGDFSESFRVLMPLPDYCWHQGEAAVIVGILCSAGGADRCQALAKSIDPNKLFPEERAIMEPWLPNLSLLGPNGNPSATMEMAQR